MVNTSRPLLAWLLAALAVLGLAGCSDEPEPAADPVQAVQASYRAYAAAVASKDGATSARLVTGATLDYYAGLRDLALTADRATLG